MSQDKFEIALQRGPDDPPENAPEFQEELQRFNNSLRSADVTFTPQVMEFKSVDAVGYQLPEFFVTLGPPVIAAVAGRCGAWVQARYGRKVRLKIGDVEAEGRTIEEIESLLKRAAEFRDNDSARSGDT